MEEAVFDFVKRIETTEEDCSFVDSYYIVFDVYDTPIWNIVYYRENQEYFSYSLQCPEIKKFDSKERFLKKLLKSRTTEWECAVCI